MTVCRQEGFSKQDVQKTPRLIIHSNRPEHGELLSIQLAPISSGSVQLQLSPHAKTTHQYSPDSGFESLRQVNALQPWRGGGDWDLFSTRSACRSERVMSFPHFWCNTPPNRPSGISPGAATTTGMITIRPLEPALESWELSCLVGNSWIRPKAFYLCYLCAFSSQCQFCQHKPPGFCFFSPPAPAARPYRDILLFMAVFIFFAADVTSGQYRLSFDFCLSLSLSRSSLLYSAHLWTLGHAAIWLHARWHREAGAGAMGES